MLNEILGRARGRIVGHRLAAAIVLAAAVLAGGLVVLLILGTGLWNWWMLGSLSAASLAIGLIRLLLSPPTRADVAQLLDERCSLADALATALYFHDSPGHIPAAQRRQAESAARDIDFARTLPFRAPRTLHVLAGLGAAAAGLFFIRYGTEEHLTLQRPIAAFAFLAPATGSPAEKKARSERDARAKKTAAVPEGVVNRLGTSTSDNPDEKDLASPEGTAVTSGAPPKDQDNSAQADGKKRAGRGEESASSGEEGASSPKQGGDQPPSTRDGAPQSAQGGSKTSGDPNGSGLMNKLRDAVSGLLSKMKPPGKLPSSNGAQNAQQANGKQAPGQQGGPKAGQQDSKGNPSEQESQESAADSEQMTPGKGAGKSTDQNASAKPGSGMGHQDGSKELKDAEQLNAMGKLSEIIGKRSANVTGEMTIEPQSGPQQLRTGYTHSSVRHGEAAGDVNRDEVPVEMQSYVQQYFDQVRKEAAGKPTRASKTAGN